MNIKTITNGRKLNEETEKMVENFEKVFLKLFPKWEIEHFFFTEKTVLTSVSYCGNTAELRIRPNSVKLDSLTMSRTDAKKLASLTLNDECYPNGRLLDLLNEIREA